MRQSEYKINESTLKVRYGNLTDLAVQVWVSSDDDQLSMSGGVARAIRRAAGEGVYSQIRAVVPLEVGRVAVTNGGKAAGVQYIFHPSIIKAKSKTVVKPKMIAEVVKRCLELANSLQVERIAFPAIGSGSAGVSFEVVARAMIETIAKHLASETTLKEVTVVLFQGSEAAKQVNELYESSAQISAAVEQRSNVGSLVADLSEAIAGSDLSENQTLIDKIDSMMSGKTRKKKQVQDIEVVEALLKELASTEILAATAPPLGPVATPVEEDTAALRQKFLTTRLNGLFFLLNIKMGKLNALEIDQANKGIDFEFMDALLDLRRDIQSTEVQIKDIENQLKLMTPEVTRDALKIDHFTAPPPDQDGRYVVLTVSVNKYNGFDSLNNAVKDGADVGRILHEQYGFETPYELFETNATLGSLNRMLTNFRTPSHPDFLGLKDRLIIFFSGHGIYKADIDQGFWLLSDATNDDDTTYFDNNRLVRSIKALKCHHVLIIADACFSGAIFRDATSSEPKLVIKLEALRSRWAIASGRLEVVSDGASGKNSPFTTYLIDYLQSPRHGDVFLVSDLGQFVKSAVANNSNQVPISRNIHDVGDEGGEMVFRKTGLQGPKRVVVANPTPPATPVPAKDPAPATQPAPPTPTPTENRLLSIVDIKKLSLEALTDGDVGLAISVIKQMPQDHRKYDLVIQLSGQFRRAEKDKMLGVISEESYTLTLNRISNAIKSLLDDLN